VFTSPTQLFCLLNSHAFLFFFIIADLTRKYGFQTSAFGFSLNKEILRRCYVEFTEPIRLSRRSNRLTNFGTASEHLHSVPCQYCNTSDISVIYATEILHFNRTVSSNSTKQGSTFTKIPLLFDYPGTYPPTYKASKSRRLDPSQAIASSGLLSWGFPTPTLCSC